MTAPPADFTSSVYLGLRHPSAALRGWSQLTTGVPAALGMPDGASRVALHLAALQGCERATLFPSTLHAFWDLFGWLARERIAVCVDAGTYPVASWGVERAAARGAIVRRFAHHRPAALRERLAHLPRDARAVVVTDGFCPSCGVPAPLEEYRAAARARGGLLIVDDTQALGILGARSAGPRADSTGPRAVSRSPGPPAVSRPPGPHAVSRPPGHPYGEGGGGSLPFAGVGGGDTLVIASLAKAFGAPIAAASGPHALVRAFERESATRVHSSTVCAPAVHAAEAALDANERRGDALRQALHEVVRVFRAAVDDAGLIASGGWFPIQSVDAPGGVDPAALHARLLQRGVRTVLLRGGCSGEPRARVAFVLNASLAHATVERAVSELAVCARRAARYRTNGESSCRSRLMEAL